MPGPSSATSSRAPPSGAAIARTDDRARRAASAAPRSRRGSRRPGAGARRRPRAGSRGARSRRRSGRRSRAAATRGSRARSSGARRTRLRSSGSVPDSSRERSSSCCTSRPSRSTCGEHRAQRLGIGLAHPVDEILEHGLQRGDRRAQLVAHVGDEVAAQPVGLRELGGHLVERAGERADLVVRDGGDPRGEVTARHRLGRGDHLPQRRGQAAGEDPHDREGDEPREHARHRRPQARPSGRRRTRRP